ncbi:MAG: hypothetical protein QMD13_05410 [Candidatus Bathyarchaeia archaeon]|nr:hypothetical protein [Candidatus Bathyarchaeia archaeon]
MEEDVERKVTYFRYCGEVNTEKVLHAIKLRCKETNLSKVVIASETGRSAIKIEKDVLCEECFKRLQRTNEKVSLTLK